MRDFISSFPVSTIILSFSTRSQHLWSFLPNDYTQDTIVIEVEDYLLSSFVSISAFIYVD
jgi:hypothetical protein